MTRALLDTNVFISYLLYPNLANKITDTVLSRFLEVLRGYTQHVGVTDEVYPAVTRDHKDDYLIAHAILARVDYLVSGDPDLLVLEEFEGVRIVSPTAFTQLLNQ